MIKEYSFLNLENKFESAILMIKNVKGMIEINSKQEFLNTLRQHNINPRKEHE